MDGNIRYAMSAVKNVGREAVRKIVEERKAGGKFTSVSNFCERISLNRKMLENLIRCGAFDSLGINRASLLASMDKILDFSKRLSTDKNDDQLSLFDFGFNVKDTIPTIAVSYTHLPSWQHIIPPEEG